MSQQTVNIKYIKLTTPTAELRKKFIKAENIFNIY